MTNLIVDYPSLVSTVTEYLARDQDTVLIARIPTFVQSFEAKMNRSLFVRQMMVRVTTIIDVTQAEPEFIALPPDFQTMRRIRLASVTGKPALDFMSDLQIEALRFQKQDVPAQPEVYTIFASEIELCPTPDQNYTVEMVYRQNIPPLLTNTTNWLCTLAPDLYLYGVLMEASPYIKQDPRIQTWASLMALALKDLNDLGTLSTFDAGPIQVRTTDKIW